MYMYSTILLLHVTILLLLSPWQLGYARTVMGFFPVDVTNIPLTTKSQGIISDIHRKKPISVRAYPSCNIWHLLSLASYSYLKTLPIIC